MTRIHRARSVAFFGLMLVAPTSLVSAQPCEAHWTDEFQIRDIDGTARAAITFDNGSGARLILGGGFGSVGGRWLGSLVSWDGAQWSPLGPNGSAVEETVLSFLPTDPGDPPGVYVSGGFELEGLGSASLAHWDGVIWSIISGGGLSIGQVVRHDDGSGRTFFGRVGTRVVKLTNNTWYPLSLYPADAAVASIAVFDDGTGPKLYAAGAFTTINKVNAPAVAVWDGVNWSPVGSGVASATGAPSGAALEVFNDGTGSALYLGGRFDTAGGQPALNIARWNDGAWSSLGGGVGSGPADSVSSMKPYQSGTVKGLLVCGTFTTAGGSPASNSAFWDGAAWSDAGVGAPPGALVLGQFDDGRGPAMAVGGKLFSGPAIRTNGVARWAPDGWSAIESSQTMGEHHGLKSPVVMTGPDGRRRIYGIISKNGNTIIQHWDGVEWTDFFDPPAGQALRVLFVFDDGTGPALYVGYAASTNLPAVMRWDGVSWTPVGNGLASTVTHVEIATMAGAEVGGQRVLYVGGRLSVTGTGPVLYRVAAWNGSVWTGLGGNLLYMPTPMAVADLGDGPKVYVGRTTSVYRWDAQAAQWSTIGGVGGLGARLNALVAGADEDGPCLYVGGVFDEASGGVAAENVARWNGAAWSAMGAGPYRTLSLRVFDDGSGPALYAGTDYWGGLLRRWNGTLWEALAPLSEGDAGALTVFDDGTGPDLVVTGGFSTIEGVSAGSVARWNGCRPHCTADFNGDSFVDGIDSDTFNNAFEIGHGSADTNGDGFVDGIDYDQFMNAYESGC